MLIREVAARATHVAVVVLGCCAVAVLLGVIVVVEVANVMRPGWGKP